ncbi:preprotein translocase subunit SecE [Buchananella felis]|uniref:preprotein translocase subunit SecE n=1 Tax=Buchananella felis TaxID=3231492 RepID=UPI0035276A78
MSEAKKGQEQSVAQRRGFFARIALFIRQVIAELKKVVTPSRDELWTYFLVVVVFVLAVMAFVGVLDFIFNQLAKLVFG